MGIQQITTDEAPKPVGPYSAGIRAGDMIFIAGQGPVDPNTGETLRSGIAEQTKRVLDNIQAILAAAGATMSNVVRTTVYLKNLDDFKEMNNTYAAYFTENPPARTTIQVAGLPGNIDVEIDAIAFLP
jgi:2-iminobutanoate/2-iminopropanoate deaminase